MQGMIRSIYLLSCILIDVMHFVHQRELVIHCTDNTAYELLLELVQLLNFWWLVRTGDTWAFIVYAFWMSEAQNSSIMVL